MTTFNKLQNAVEQQFQKMCETGLYSINLNTEEKEILWEKYLWSIPAASNHIYYVRTEHDCTCCRHFLRDMGAVVTIQSGKIKTLWDFDINTPYKTAVARLAAFVRSMGESKGISNVFLTPFSTIGIKENRRRLSDGFIQTFNHFYVQVPKKYTTNSANLGVKLGEAKTSYEMLFRALTELKMETLNTVLNLIEENGLYRGQEHQSTLQQFVVCKEVFQRLQNSEKQSLYCWEQISLLPLAVIRIRNTAIGTLLVSLSEGVELEEAVRAYENMVAPMNYQRPTALVTKKQIMEAQAQIEALDLLPALKRRYAVIEDIKIPDIIWANRSTRKVMGDIFSQLQEDVVYNKMNTNRIQEIPIEHFINEVLPNASEVEILVENRHARNFVSLIAPFEKNAPKLFHWDNNFSWTYSGDLTDSVKERVKNAGGNVTGDFRASLAWYNYDDLDLHLREPNGFEIYYGAKISPNKGQLDVDMNAGSGRTREPVENIVYASKHSMLEGVYKLFVHQFSKRENQNFGFQVELEFMGKLYTFDYNKMLRLDAKIEVIVFRYTRKGGLEIIGSLPQLPVNHIVWGVPTQTLRKVNVILLSPNHWDGEQGIGNKHYFFMLDGCLREGSARGIFNEFLRSELRPYRHVLERVGAYMKIEEETRQLSGLGFSSTLRNELICQVKGSQTRMFKITF